MSYRNCDSVVKSVIESFVKRSEVGKKKYDTDLDRTDLNISEWLNTHKKSIWMRFYI